MRAAGQRHVRSRIDKQLRARATERGHGLQRQVFQRSSFQVLLPQLDQINASRGALGNFRQQPLLLLMGIARKLPPVRDVVELQGHWPAL